VVILNSRCVNRKLIIMTNNQQPIFVGPQPTYQYPQYYSVPAAQPAVVIASAPVAPQPIVYAVPVAPSDHAGAPLLGGEALHVIHSEDLVQHLSARTYEVQIGKWFDEAWILYKEHWGALVLATILFIAIQFIPYVGGLLAFPIPFGMFIAGTHALRSSGTGWNSSMIFRGYLYFFPMLWIGFLSLLAVLVGLILLIIPGLYLMIALHFAAFVYIEYRGAGLGVIQSMTVSRRVVHKHFCSILLFLIVCTGLILLGLLSFGIGLLVTIPLTMLMTSVAVRDMFGLQPAKPVESGCMCC